MAIKILLADDHPIFINGMTALLNEVKDFEVIGGALNGEELIAFWFFSQLEKMMPKEADG